MAITVTRIATRAKTILMSFGSPLFFAEFNFIISKERQKTFFRSQTGHGIAANESPYPRWIITTKTAHANLTSSSSL